MRLTRAPAGIGPRQPAEQRPAPQDDGAADEIGGLGERDRVTSGLDVVEQRADELVLVACPPLGRGTRAVAGGTWLPGACEPNASVATKWRTRSSPRRQSVESGIIIDGAAGIHPVNYIVDWSLELILGRRRSWPGGCSLSPGSGEAVVTSQWTSHSPRGTHRASSV
jgi:hypothetical protein